jgi:hypothetical protein
MQESQDQDRNVLNLLRDSLRLLRAGEQERAIENTSCALRAVDSSGCVLPSRVDFYLAALFELLLAQKSQQGTLNLFDLVKQSLFLKANLEEYMPESTIRAYVKAMYGFRREEEAVQEILDVVALREEMFGSEGSRKAELLSLLELSRKYEFARDSKRAREFWQSEFRERESKKFVDLITTIEDKLDSDPKGIKLQHVASAGSYLSDYPGALESDPDLKTRVLNCIREVFGQEIIEDVVSRLICYQRTCTKQSHTDFMPLLAEILLDCQSGRHISDRLYAEALSALQVESVRKESLIPIMTRALSHLWQRDYDSAINVFQRLVAVCVEMNQLPPNTLMVPSICAKEPTCRGILAMIKIGKKFSSSETKWLHVIFRDLMERSIHVRQRESSDQRILKNWDLVEENTSLSEQPWLEMLLLEIISLMKSMAEPDYFYLDEYSGMLAYIYLESGRQSMALALFDEFSSRYNSRAICPEFVQRVWEKVRYKRGRRHQKVSRSSRHLLELFQNCRDHGSVPDKSVASTCYPCGVRKGRPALFGNAADFEVWLPGYT